MLSSKLPIIAVKTYSLIFLLCFSLSEIAIAQDPFLRHEQETLPTPTAEPVKRFPGYGPYREAAQRFCQFLLADGHVERWNAALQRAESLQADCKNCRQLYKTLSCKLQGRKAQNKNVTKVSMPSTELLAAGSELFINLASEPQVAAQTADALRTVLGDLLKPLEPLGDEYFAILTAYIQPPLAEYLQQSEKLHEVKKKADSKKVLDKLF